MRISLKSCQYRSYRLRITEDQTQTPVGRQMRSYPLQLLVNDKKVRGKPVIFSPFGSLVSPERSVQPFDGENHNADATTAD